MRCQDSRSSSVSAMRSVYGTPRLASQPRPIVQASPQLLAVYSVTGKRVATSRNTKGSADSPARPVSGLTGTTRPSLVEGVRSV